jgi:hypothetical protein
LFARLPATRDAHSSSQYGKRGSFALRHPRSDILRRQIQTDLMMRIALCLLFALLATRAVPRWQTWIVSRSDTPVSHPEAANVAHFRDPGRFTALHTPSAILRRQTQIDRMMRIAP